MEVSGRFIILHDSEKRKCHLGTVVSRLFTFLISWGKCCACKLWARWTGFHFSEGKLLAETRNHPLHGVCCAIVLYPYISSCPTSPFTLWWSDKRWANTWAWTCAWVCVWQGGSRRGVGESNLSHRGAETGRQICSKPRITLAVSMNEMTGLQGY